MSSSLQDATESIETYRMFVGGKWVDSTSGKYFDVLNPYTGRVWARAPRGNAEDVNRAVASAKEALESETWREMTGATRRNLLLALGRLVEQNAERLALAETRSNGKLYGGNLQQSKMFSEFFYYYAGWADKLVGETIPLTETRDIFCYTIREPVGVVAAITPWNAPLLLSAMKMAPALAGGNTLVMKPSRYTPLTAIILAELASKAGFPPGVVNVVTGIGSEVGDTLLRHRDVNKVSFTGSTEVGREVLRSVSENIAKVTLELGGKSPNIVFDDAEMDNAVNGVLGGIFAFSGQVCVAGSRVLLQSGIADEFVERLARRARTIKLGDPMESQTEMGPIANLDQLAKVEKYVELGQKEGGVVVCGGKRPEDPGLAGGLFYPPTIMRVKNSMRVAQEEIFGPVVGIIEFEEDEEAIRLANDTPYGLAAGIWTTNMRRANRMVHRLKAGTVWINTYGLLPAAAGPFGGYKQSGVGRENGSEAMKEYTQLKCVWLDLHEKIGDIFTPPST